MSTRQKISYLLSFLFLILSTVPAFAEETSSPLMKLNRGLANIATAPLEYMNEFERLKKTNDPGTALMGGIFFGTVMTASRLVTGALEVLTFPFPIPPGYQSIMNPPTAWDDFKEIK